MSHNKILVGKEALLGLHPLRELLADDLEDLAKNTPIETLPAGSELFAQGATDLTIVNNIFWNEAPENGYPLTGNRVNTLDPQVNQVTHLPGVRLPPVDVPD